MQSEASAIRAFELPAEMVGAWQTWRVDSQPAISCGALLEWLLAITREAIPRGEPRTGTRALGVRLTRVVHHPAESLSSEPLSCRVENGFAVARPARAGSTLLLQACVELSPRFEARPAPAAVCCESIRSDAWYAELARAGLDVEAEGRAIESVTRSQVAAFALLCESARDRDSGFIIGPRALDAALQLAFDAAVRATGRASARLCPWPSIERVEVSGEAAATTTVSLTVQTCATQPPHVNVRLFDAGSREVARLDGVTFVARDAVPARQRDELARVFERLIRACLPDLGATLDVETELPLTGASSLDLIRIGAHADEMLGWAPPLATWFTRPTLAALVDNYLSRDRGIDPAVQLDTSEALSPVERQLWFLERGTNARGAYNEGCAFRLRGPLSIDALQRALAQVQRDHPALRSYFPALDGRPQRKLDWRQCQLELVETPASVREAPELLAQLIEDQICRPFDLEHAPPIRCALLLHAASDATLVVSAHHILCDAWSFSHVLVPELSRAYRALLDGAQSPPAPPPPNELERSALTQDYEARAAAYFRRALANAPQLLDFPFDHARPAVQTHRGGCVRRPLAAARWRAIKQWSRELGQSPFVVTLAVYAILLRRYARSDDLCIGVPLSLRRGASDLRAFGCFVSLSVLRARVADASDFAELCRGLKTELTGVLQFDRFGLGDIVRAVSPERSLGHTPLVQAVFAYRELAGSELDLAGATATPSFVHNRRAKFDLTLAIDDCGEEAVLSLEYASDLLEAESASRVLEHYEALLAELDRKPNVRIGALSLASPHERQRLAGFELGGARPVMTHDLGLALLRDRPDDAPALRTLARSWSTSELRELVKRIVAALESAGVWPGNVVAICAPRSAEWVAAVLAILELGAAYVPLDPQQPVSRTRLGVARAGTSVVLTLNGAFACAAAPGLKVLELSALSIMPEPVPGSVPSPTSGTDTGSGTSPILDRSREPVYGILTSGSTGTPRIARVSHAAVANLLAWYLDALQLRATDRVLFATSVGFDLSQKNLFAALIAGAELVIDDADSFDPERIVRAIERFAISVLNCTPTLASALVACAAARDIRRLRSIRVLVLGGEPIDFDSLRAWLDHPSCSARILNTYGPTECTDVVSAAIATPGAPDAGRILGTPIPNARCRVIDIAGTIAAIGVPGELWISGAPLGLGYLGDPSATAAKFVRKQGTRWYRTGDLVRWTAAGELQYLGRLDLQLKLRGYRIEPAEIEAALEQQPEIAAAAVAPRIGPRGAALVGYVVRAPGAELDEDDLAIQLQPRLANLLPSYLIPAAIVCLDRLPRTASGKLDRSALAAVPLKLRTAEQAEVEPEIAAVLSRVRAAVCEVLGLATVASEASFFEVGGHSLAAVHLAEKLETELGLRIAVTAILERPRLRELAVWIAQQVPRAADNHGHLPSALRSTSPAP
jgi:amino acid adenylation domain-containing protein